MSVKPTIVELILNATAAGKSMLSAANAAAQKTLLSLVKGDVGLGNVDNTSDANKPVSTAQQTALDAKADLVGGVVPSAQIPAIAITEYLGSVANQAAMLALVGDRGDWCLRSDTGTTFVLSNDDSSLLASWIELNYPTAPVTSVNGETGAVTLSASDVGAAATSHTHAQSDVTNLTTDLAAKAAAATTITAGTGLSGGGDLSANRTLTLANTAVTAGSYTSADITVDAQGRLTAAANGSGGGGSPGGSSGQIQYNNAGTFGGTPAIVYAGSGTHVTVTSQGSTVVPLCVKTAASQVAPAVEIRNSANTVMASIYDTGGFYGVIFQASGTIISNKNQSPTNLGIQFSYGGGSATGIYGLAGGSQYVGITANGSDSFRIDSNTTSGNTRMLLWDCDKGTTVRVSIGAADSGGTGYKVLRVPN